MRQFKVSKQITERDSYAMELYLAEISKIKSLTPQEEAALATAIKQGDKQAEERLVLANLRFVVSVAKQYQHYGLRLEDLINEGNVGLLKAAHFFDETKGFKFISYYRVLRSIKNRFGSTAELGIYEMRREGLRQVSNPSELLLSERHNGVLGLVEQWCDSCF